MVTVNKNQVSLEGTKIVGEASTMGLAPGEWPGFIAVVDDANDGFLFRRAEHIILVPSAEFGGYTYRSTVGTLTMVVLND